MATPIGNLRDITFRAVDTLSAAHVIACEDRRVTAKLLRAYDIRTPTLTYNDHNAPRIRPKLIERLQKGESVALVSDAGTPLIADPGYRLVRDCAAAGVPVVSVPGANAAITALAAAGLATDSFLFVGFLPPRTAARRRRLAALASIDATLVFYESPRRVAAALGDMAEVLGARREAAVARELTKLHEEIVRADLAGLAARYADADPPKGEVVVLAGPPPDGAAPDAAEVDELLRAALQDSSLRDAAAQVSAVTGVARREVYARAVQLKEK